MARSFAFFCAKGWGESPDFPYCLCERFEVELCRNCEILWLFEEMLTDLLIFDRSIGRDGEDFSGAFAV